MGSRASVVSNVHLYVFLKPVQQISTYFHFRLLYSTYVYIPSHCTNLIRNTDQHFFRVLLDPKGIRMYVCDHYPPTNEKWKYFFDWGLELYTQLPKFCISKNGKLQCIAPRYHQCLRLHPLLHGKQSTSKK